MPVHITGSQRRGYKTKASCAAPIAFHREKIVQPHGVSAAIHAGAAGRRKGRPPERNSAEQTEPWEGLRMSRRTWYRRKADATTQIKPGPLKLGRPKIKGPRPWEERGMSRRTYYRRLASKRAVE